MKHPAVPTRDRVLAYILAHIEKNGEPPYVKVTAHAVGISERNVKAATRLLMIEGRLKPEQRSFQAFSKCKLIAIATRVSRGGDKCLIAREMNVGRATVYRALKQVSYPSHAAG